MARDRSWIDMNRDSAEWQSGVKEFLDYAFEGSPGRSTALCPCRRCLNAVYKERDDVHVDLLMNGMDPSYTCWKYHGEDSNDESTAEESEGEGVRGDDFVVRDLLNTLIRSTEPESSKTTCEASSEEMFHDDGNITEGSAEGGSTQEPSGCAKAFFSLLKDAEKELYPGCKELTKLSFIVRLYQIKCLFGLSNKACEAVLQLFTQALPKGHCIPNSLEKVQKVIRDLGLDYQKIHACINDCVLFWKEYVDMDYCPTCKECRWKAAAIDDSDVERRNHKGKKQVARKVLRYFPLTPRLQRLFMTDATSSYMRWHKDDRVDDGIMRHPADSLAWKHFDNIYAKGFSSDARNVRLGLASDGFNPYGIMNVAYSCWPVILIPYNLPPWLCLKQPYWLMSMIIPGKKSPGNNIDVYLQPLIDELKDLWYVGADTYDATTKKNFRMLAAIYSKELNLEELVKLSRTIPETLCRLEMILPPQFFDIMMHLPIHLVEEARLGGPVAYRCMYPVERYLRTLKGYVRNKAHPEGSIAEGYIAEECLTFCSRFFDNIDTKLNRSERHEAATRDEGPAGLSVLGIVDHSKKGFTFETLSKAEMKKIRHYIITNCEEANSWIDEHLDELTRTGARIVQKRHKNEFVDWFQRRIQVLHKEGKVNDLLYALSRGPDPRARVYNRTFINGFFFRNATVERDLNTQNSGVVVRADARSGNLDWFGVIKKIICVDFPSEKEVVLFQCDWFDVPPANKNHGTGYKKDDYGYIDVDTTVLRYRDDPYILGIQAEQVFYVRDVEKINWASIVRMKPRDLYAMPSTGDDDDGTRADVDLLDIVVGDTIVQGIDEDVGSWSRSGMEGVSGDASDIPKILEVDAGDDELESDSDCYDDDETYINDGHVAHLVVDESDDDEFFV